MSFNINKFKYSLETNNYSPTLARLLQSPCRFTFLSFRVKSIKSTLKYYISLLFFPQSRSKRWIANCFSRLWSAIIKKSRNDSIFIYKVNLSPESQLKNCRSCFDRLCYTCDKPCAMLHVNCFFLRQVTLCLKLNVKQIVALI